MSVFHICFGFNVYPDTKFNVTNMLTILNCGF